MARLAAVAALCALLTLACLQVQDLHGGVDAHEDGAVEDGWAPLELEDQKIRGVPSGLTTDAQVVERESESISPKTTLRSHGEKFEFQAEVSRLMDIIINSLYSNKDIFLRELISNASDALDKIRFLSLTDKTLLGEGGNANLDIHIKVDNEKKILSIRDRGIGMTKEDLIKNLGTIAKSGTSSFVEQMQKGGDLNLIGQFGVGFYSVYLIADYVEVISKHNDDNQYIWESSADGNFAVSEDTENEPLGRGTEIRIHLKKDAAEYSTEARLRELVKKFSEFINFPIYLWASKEIEKPVEEGKEEGTTEKEEETTEKVEPSDVDKDSEDGEKAEGTGDAEGEDEDQEESKAKTIKHTEWDWELLNDVKAVWLRNPKEVTPDEYKSFYHSLTKDFGKDEPLAWTHFNAEGDVEFKAVLFIPPKATADMFDNYYTNKVHLKLYVRRVFISDEFDDLLPKYLAFLKGIVDSDTLPLNVSREMLQQHSSLKTIKKKLIRKALDMIKRMVDDDPDERLAEEDRDEEEEEEQTEKERGKYAEFWREFGKAVKMGIIEDTTNRNRMAKLVRFHSSKSGEKLTSFDHYISRMKPDQKHIYFITGQDRKQLERSPFLEKLLKKDYEVIYFTDPLDEYLMQNLSEYEEKRLQNASKDNLKIGGTDDKAKTKKLRDAYKELTKWWKDVLTGENVESVKVSTRLDDTPSVVVTSKTGWSSNMERIMFAQTLSDPSRQAYMKSKRILEINARHPIIQELRQKVALNPEDEAAKQSATLIYKTALLESGFLLEDPKDFAARIYTVIKSNLNVSPDAEVDEEEEEEEADKDDATEAVPQEDAAGTQQVEPGIEVLDTEPASLGGDTFMGIEEGEEDRDGREALPGFAHGVEHSEITTNMEVGSYKDEL